MKDINKNDVIQIVPENKWGGCLAIVSEVKSWGVQCFVQIPLQGRAYYRVNWDEFDFIGEALYVPQE